MTYTWSIPAGKAITGTTLIKDTDNNISATVDDLVEFVNGAGAHAGQGLTFDLVDKASAQTVAGAKTFTSAIVASGGVTGNVTGNITGNSDTTTKLATTRAITLEGDATGTATFDGSAPVTITASFRTGMIVLWSGAVVDIPTGWLLCNGLSGTPNLMDRAVIGAGSGYAVGASGDGSIPSHVHNADHNHSGSTASNGSHDHELYGSGGYSGGSSTYPATSMPSVGTTSRLPISSDGAHTHTVTVDTKSMNTLATGTGTAVVPKHYALAYIMKG
jgi:hypothetical protein